MPKKRPIPTPPRNNILELGIKYYPLTVSIVILTIVYLVVTFATPVDQATLHRYHVSSGSVEVLLLTITLPYIVIWYMALIGYLRLRDYTQAIKDTKDGAALGRISMGILWLTLWLPVAAVVSALTSYYYHKHPAATAQMVWLNNYAGILLLFPAFWFCYDGSRKLVRLVRQPERMLLVGAVAYIIFAVLYTFLTLHDSSRRVPSHGVTVASYYLQDWLIVTTIIIPRLVEWLLGFQAAYNLYVYQTKVKGTIYKEALSRLSVGLSSIVVIIIILRCLQSLSGQLNKESLGILLLLIYVLLILIAVGYALIARGAKNLKRIESL